MNQLMIQLSRRLRKRTKWHLHLCLQTFLAVSLLLAPAPGVLAQDVGDESPVPTTEIVDQAPSAEIVD